MFSKAALFIAASLAAFAAACPTSQCNTGSIQCCNEVHDVKSQQGAALLGLNNINAQGLTGFVGAQCSPITGVGVGAGSKCKQSPMCCTNNTYNGLIVVGCTMINIDL